jgi:hypothetical protein
VGLAATHLGLAPAHLALAPAHHGGIVALGGGSHHPHGPHLPPSGRPGIGPGLGHGLIRLALPGNFLDYGVVTIWNNTRAPATIWVSASTFRNGEFFPFILGSGQFRSFYAAVDTSSGALPLFQVSFGPGTDSIPLPHDNLIFESPAYFPAGTAGWPYAINFGVDGYYISYI